MTTQNCFSEIVKINKKQRTEGQQYFIVLDLTIGRKKKLTIGETIKLMLDILYGYEMYPEMENYTFGAKRFHNKQTVEDTEKYHLIMEILNKTRVFDYDLATHCYGQKQLIAFDSFNHTIERSISDIFQKWLSVAYDWDCEKYQEINKISRYIDAFSGGSFLRNTVSKYMSICYCNEKEFNAIPRKYTIELFFKKQRTLNWFGYFNDGKITENVSIVDMLIKNDIYDAIFADTDLIADLFNSKIPEKWNINQKSKLEMTELTEKLPIDYFRYNVDCVIKVWMYLRTCYLFKTIPKLRETLTDFDFDLPKIFSNSLLTMIYNCPVFQYKGQNISVNNILDFSNIENSSVIYIEDQHPMSNILDSMLYKHVSDILPTLAYLLNGYLLLGNGSLRRL